MSERKPIPMMSVNVKAICPICGKPSYSASGVHPQCAVAKADSERRAALKAAEAAIAPPPVKASFKPCPQCRREMPARRVICDCGYQFLFTPINARQLAARTPSQTLPPKTFPVKKGPPR